MAEMKLDENGQPLIVVDLGEFFQTLKERVDHLAHLINMALEQYEKYNNAKNQ